MGENDLIFCHDDMKRAIETFLNEHYFKTPIEVKSVEMADHMVKTFRIRFEEKHNA